MTPEQEKFLQTAEGLKGPLYSLLLAYENLSDSDNSDTSNLYPFKSSYDEWIHEFYAWVNNLNKRWSNRVFDHNPTLTIGELKKIISDMDDSTQVVIEDTKSIWWLNISKTEKPDNESIFTLAFTIGNSFDTRQL